MLRLVHGDNEIIIAQQKFYFISGVVARVIRGQIVGKGVAALQRHDLQKYTSAD